MLALEKIKAAEEMQTYIEEHIHEEITMHALAACTSYSPWHASRIFKEVSGMTPFEYIRKLRLSQAAVDLWDSNTRILDIALDYLFDSHDGFTRAFRKQFGLTPSEYKQKTPPLPLFKPSSFRDHYRYIQGNDPLPQMEELSKTYFVQVLEFPKRKLIYMPCEKEADDYFSYVEEVGCDVWGILCSIKEALYEPVGLWFSKSICPKGCSRYVQGVEVPFDYAKELPEGCAIMDLDACSMMMFQGSPYPDEYYDEAIRYLHQEIDAYDPTLYGYQWAENSIKIQLEPLGYRGYIEGRAVTEKI